MKNQFNSTVVSILVTLFLLPVHQIFAQNKITSPEEFFGFQMGADYKLARWDKMVDYYY